MYFIFDVQKEGYQVYLFIFVWLMDANEEATQ